jgi:phosphate transport system substrate-binding protein
MILLRRIRVALVAGLVALSMVVVAAPRADAASAINGSGSTYVALAMQQWVADAQSQGLSVNYLPTGSPDGLTSYGNSLTDFAGTEAEFSALTRGGSGGTPGDVRGYQYVPDVAGAVSVMYNVDDGAGRRVDYLHLSMRTIARIFTGDIAYWDDGAIAADNLGLQLPHQPITVVYRSGQSGTTALFYDFVANVAPDVFGPWAARNQLPTNVRIIQLDSTPNFAPRTVALNGSDQIAQYVAGNSGKWSIAYDEFGYAVTYGAPAAWVKNASGNWVLPYAQNISAALESATLRPDLSQELSGVYASPNPEAYPISAYSYITTMCERSGDRPTCKGSYPNAGVSETLAKWLRYIACEGQVPMARIGYSPLPANLSQEIANSIARLQGTAPEALTADNCANPRFRGSLGEGAASPPDPLAGVTDLSGDSSQTPAASQAAGSTDGAAQTAAAGGAAVTGRKGSTKAVGGGSDDWRDAHPVAYTRPGIPGTDSVPLIVFLLIVALPPLVAGVIRVRKQRAP